MATQSNKGVITCKLFDSLTVTPIEWADVEAELSYDNESVQAELTISTLTFTLTEKKKIDEFISLGLAGGVGIFEGIPLEITLSNINDSRILFVGFLDLTNNMVIDNENNRVKCNIIKADGLQALEMRISALTFGYLESLNKITTSHYTTSSYVVETTIKIDEEIITAISLYLMIKELQEAILRTYALIIETVAFITSSVTSGWVAAALNLAAKLIINIAYTYILLRAITSLIKKIIVQYAIPSRPCKLLNFKTGLNVIFNHLGYNVVTNITELDNYYYLPSNNNYDVADNEMGGLLTLKGVDKGLPLITDIGYKCIDFYNFSKQMFNLKLMLKENNIYIYNEFDPIWETQSTFILPNVIEQPYGYNTNELTASRIITFDTDLKDDYTIKNYSGTSNLVVTDAITTNNAKGKFIKGIDEINIPLCLGSRKNELIYLEKILFELAQIADSVIEFFGGDPIFASQISNKIGGIKISSNNWTKPKAIYLLNGKIPETHRLNLSARYLNDKFYIGKSFVKNNFYAQKKVFSNVKIPFTFENFLQLLENSYFTAENGSTGKITSCKFKIEGNYAVVDYWVKHIYTTNLQEKNIEP